MNMNYFGEADSLLLKWCLFEKEGKTFILKNILLKKKKKKRKISCTFLFLETCTSHYSLFLLSTEIDRPKQTVQIQMRYARKQHLHKIMLAQIECAGHHQPQPDFFFFFFF